MTLRPSRSAAFGKPTPEEDAAPAMRAPGSFNFLAVPFDICFRIYEFCLVSAGQISLNRISEHPNRPKSGTTRNPLVPYPGGMGSPISYKVESRCLPFNMNILQTCQTIYKEGTPVLYGKNRFLQSVDFDTFEREKSLTQNRLPDAEIVTTGGAYLAWLPHLKSLRLCVGQLSSMTDCGLWNTLVCHSSSLNTITLTPGHYIDKFLENVVCLAYNVTNAHIHAEKANLSPFVIVRIEDDGCEDFISTGTSRLWTAQHIQNSKSPQA
jgi:hypothetical protein